MQTAELPTMDQVADQVAIIDQAYKRAQLKGLYKKSPYVLAKEVLGYNAFCDTQLDWDDFVRAEIKPNNLTNFKGLFLFPREVFKTTYYTITLPIWLLINNPNLSILICNEIYGNAVSFLREIKGHMEKNEKLIEYFGEFKTKNEWRTTDIVIAQRTKARKEPSIMTAGLGATLTSQHPDIIIMDDIAGPGDRDSEAKRKQTFHFFNDSWDLLKKDKSAFIMVGTRWHKQDIYSHVKEKIAPDLKKKDLGTFHVMVKPVKTGEKLNYPRLLPEKKLKELRTVKQGMDGLDISSFMAQYYLDPLDPSTQVFKEFHYVDINGLKYSRMLQWTDPALSTDKSADYSATIVIAKIEGGDYDGKWVCHYASIKRRAPTELINDHNRIFRMFVDPVPRVYMENNGFQTIMRNKAIDQSMKDGKKPVPTKGITNTQNKDQRIRSLEPAITLGLLMFRDDWQTAPEGYRLLMDQLTNYPQDKKDGPDALAGAFKQATKSGTSLRRF